LGLRAVIRARLSAAADRTRRTSVRFSPAHAVGRVALLPHDCPTAGHHPAWSPFLMIAGPRRVPPRSSTPSGEASRAVHCFYSGRR